MDDENRHIFPDVLDFNESADIQMLDHYNKIIHAIRFKLWYDLDNFKLVSNSELKRLRKLKQVYQVSKNKNHPVFGQVRLYAHELGPQLVDLSYEVGDITQSLMLTVKLFETEEDRNAVLLTLLPKLSTELIQAMCNANTSFLMIACKRRLIWEDLWSQSYPTIPIPVIYDLRRLWLELRRRTKRKIEYFRVDEELDNDVLKGKLIRFASRLKMIHGDEIHIKSYGILQSENIKVVIQTVNGISIVPKSELTDELDFLKKIVQSDYFN